MKKKDVYGNWHKVKLFLSEDPSDGFHIKAGKKMTKAFVKRLNDKRWMQDSE